MNCLGFRKGHKTNRKNLWFQVYIYNFEDKRYQRYQEVSKDIQKISKRCRRDVEDMSKICLTKLVLYPISFDQHFDQRPWVLEHLNLELVPKSVSGLL